MRMYRLLRVYCFTLLMIVSAQLALAAPIHTTDKTAPVAIKQAYHGNRKSHVFHQSSCRYYMCKNCVVVFHTKQEALAKGYRPCKVCKP